VERRCSADRAVFSNP